MLYDKVYNFITEHKLITEPLVICALSGGADSVCLADIMIKLAPRLGITVECAHLNHNLRGDESDGDEQYVRFLCDRFSVPLHVKSVEVSRSAHGVGIEDAARQARYAFFEELTADRNAQIVTAHTVNDNTETFFINLLRGSGSRGLCGIPLVRGNIARPLLCVERKEILAHLDAVGLSYRTDSSNSDTAYLRNFIRHEIIPVFSKRADININKSVSKAMSNLYLENEALASYADNVDSDNVERLLCLPDAVLYRVLDKRLESTFGISLNNTHFKAVRTLLSKQNGKCQIQGDIFASVRYGKLAFDRIVRKNDTVARLDIGENYYSDKKILIKKQEEIYNGLTNNVIDCDKINSVLYARTRRDGDVFYHPTRKVTTRLKKLLINDKMDITRRDSLIVVVDMSGNTVFVEGYGVDSRFAANKTSKNIIGIEII